MRRPPTRKPAVFIGMIPRAMTLRIWIQSKISTRARAGNIVQDYCLTNFLRVVGSIICGATHGR